MSFFNLDGVLVSVQTGQPVKKGTLKVDEIAKIASETTKERLQALNFELAGTDTSATFYRHLRLPGTNQRENSIATSKSKSALLMLPHLPANAGLWSNELCVTANLEFCTVLPHIEQQLMLSDAPIFLISPFSPVSLRENMEGALEAYHKQVLQAWNTIKEGIESLDVLAFGFGGAALVLAMAVDSRLAPRIHKVSFVECDDYVAKALNKTSKASGNHSDNLHRTSPIVNVLKRRAIMFKLDTSPMGKVIKDEKESGCGCPVVSIGTSNKELVALEGAALGLAYFRKKDSVAIPKWFLAGIILIFLFLLMTTLYLSSR